MAKKMQFKLPEELNKSLVTGRFRCSYEHLVEPWSGDPSKDARYSVQMIFGKGDKFIRTSKNLVKKIAVEAFGPNAIKLLRRGKLHNPFRDGDDEFPDDETYNGKVFVNANGSFVGKKATPLYDRKKRDMRKLEDVEEYIYSGCYGRAEIKFFPYDREGGKGVACYLFRFQWLEHGEPLGGGRPVDEVFDDLEEEDPDDFDDDDEDDDF